MITLEQVNGSNFAYERYSFDYFLDAMVQLDRRRIEIWGTSPHLSIATTTWDDVRRVRSSISARGLEVDCLTPEQVVYPYNIASSDPTLRAASIAMFRRAAEIAAELGSAKLFVTSGWGLEDEDRAAAWDRSVTAIAAIVDRAAELGVSCVLEALQRTESNLVITSADVAAVIEAVGSDSLGAVVDTVAMATAGESVDDWFALLGRRIRHVHLVDGTPSGHYAWGDGDLPLTSYLKAFDKHGYAGPFTFELFGDGDYALDPSPVLERSLEAFADATS